MDKITKLYDKILSICRIQQMKERNLVEQSVFKRIQKSVIMYKIV